jgi:hypothetical protein
MPNNHQNYLFCANHTYQYRRSLFTASLVCTQVSPAVAVAAHAAIGAVAVEVLAAPVVSDRLGDLEGLRLRASSKPFNSSS